MITLNNGCADERLVGWSERAVAHEVVGACYQMASLNENWIAIIEDLETYGVLPAELGVLKCSEFLFVEFEAICGEGGYIALLATGADTVILCRDMSDGVEIVGTMSHHGFWAYLGSFPNVFKHLKVGNGQQKYWSGASST